MPNEATVRGWDVEDRQGFSTQYARARALRVERWAEEIIELADEPVAPGDNAAVQRARLRVDTRKWLMSKLAPRKYGDRVEHIRSRATRPTSPTTSSPGSRRPRSSRYLAPRNLFRKTRLLRVTAAVDVRLEAGCSISSFAVDAKQLYTKT